MYTDWIISITSLLCATAFAGVGVGIWRVAQRTSAVSGPTCANCGYSRVGLSSSTCPECGSNTDGAGTQLPGDLMRRAILLRVIAWALFLFLPAVLVNQIMPPAFIVPSRTYAVPGLLTLIPRSGAYGELRLTSARERAPVTESPSIFTLEFRSTPLRNKVVSMIPVARCPGDTTTAPHSMQTLDYRREILDYELRAGGVLVDRPDIRKEIDELWAAMLQVANGATLAEACGKLNGFWARPVMVTTGGRVCSASPLSCGQIAGWLLIWVLGALCIIRMHGRRRVKASNELRQALEAASREGGPSVRRER